MKSPINRNKLFTGYSQMEKREPSNKLCLTSDDRMNLKEWKNARNSLLQVTVRH